MTIAALKRFALLDVPNERSSHVAATPRGGGLACLAGGGAGLITAKLLGQSPGPAALIGAGIMGTVGFMDDIYGLSPRLRLSAQLLTGASCGWLIGGWRLGLLGSVSMPAVVNAFNFMDGINGISGTTLLAWGLSTGRFARLVADPNLYATASIAQGAAAGFLPWNVPKASVFLGDVGSYMIGGLITGAALEAAANLRRRGYFTILAPLTYYFADTGMTIFVRLKRREQLFDAHRDHAYQLMVNEAGFEHWQMATLSGAAAISSGLIFQLTSGKYGFAIIPIIVASWPRIEFGSASRRRRDFLKLLKRARLDFNLKRG